MADLLGTAAVLAPIVEIVFLAIAVYYAVNVARRVGTFWAWSIVVVAFIVQGIRALIILVLSIPMSPDQLAAFGQTVGPDRIMGAISAIFLAAGMYGLSGIFKRTQDSRRNKGIQN